MHPIVDCAFIVFCAWLHRWRGGGWPKIDLPGGPSVAPSLLLGLVVWPIFGWPAALLFGLGYCAANILGHGSYVDVGTAPPVPETEVPWIDKIVRPRLGWGWQGDLAGLALYGSMALPLFIGSVFILHSNPGKAILWWVVLQTITIAAYAGIVRLLRGYVKYDRNALAEIATGLAWGIALVGIVP